MAKPTGFMDYRRMDVSEVPAAERVANFECFHGELDADNRKRQAGRCMDCGVSFCQAGIFMDGRLIGCPLRNLIPEWNDQLWCGNLPLALERLLRTNSFPEFTGYVCPAPCEDSCACGKVASPVSINANERYIIETAFQQGLIKAQPPRRRSGLKVAVVGSGPAGLNVAALLNRRGHAVSVFERDARPGGLLVYGIPNMKLPKEVVARRVALLEEEGVAFECGVNVGVDVSVEALRDRFDAVVLAVGAQEPRRLAVADAGIPGVCYALDYLGAAIRAQLGEAALQPALDAKGKVVAVVGAGDSANDCIATALRQGAADVVQLIRRPAADYAPMNDYAHEEAAAVFGRDIRRFETQVAEARAGEDGTLAQLTLNGPQGSQELPAGMLVVASGFTGPEAYALQGLELGEEDGVFFAGDAALGSTLVVSAMANARSTAAKVDAYLLD